MPPKPKIGSVVSGKKGNYRLEQEIADGNMSWALRAVNTDTGEAVFLKYYKSPTPTVAWYPRYLEYVAQLNKRLTDSAAAQYCVLARDLFTANPRPKMCPCEFFYSTYDFIESGYDLRKLMDDSDIPWEKRKSIAKVFLSSMKKIHEAKVIHCDLKPENVQMLPAPGTVLGLIPRMIDMDFSIMADVPAPWSSGPDKQGYTGTPGYFSPEHLRGETPGTASDVFTIAVILGELLGGKHPFASINNGAEEYKSAVLAGNKFEHIRLLGDLGGSSANAQAYAELLEKCFSPKASARPSCAELHKKLLELDRMSSNPQPLPGAMPPESPGPVPPDNEKTSVPPNPPSAFKTLCLQGDIGVVKVRIGMTLGAASLGAASSQARFAVREQFSVERSGEGWYIVPPESEVRNVTALDGVPVTERTLLKEGSVICLMGKSSGKTAMPLTVSFA